MKTLITAAVFGAVLALTTLAVQAGEKTFAGTICCEKCELKKADACGDVLAVKDGDKTTLYLIEENGKRKTSQHQCQGTAKAKVTGKIEDRDGVKYIVASKIEKEKKG